MECKFYEIASCKSFFCILGVFNGGWFVYVIARAGVKFGINTCSENGSETA